MIGSSSRCATLAARSLGLIFIAASLALAAGLMLLPPPSHALTVGCALILLLACGLALLTRGVGLGGGVAVAIACTGVVIAGTFVARSENRSLPPQPLSIDATADGCALSVRGGLTEDFYQRLRRSLDDHPRVRTLLISSAGGTALSITQSAQLLRDRQVDTAVMYEQCDSACAFLWVSAPRRIIAGADRRLAPAFHAPQIPVPGFGAVRALLQESQQRRYLQRVAQLPDSFIGWAYAPVDGLWRPDARQLNLLGVATQFVQTRHPEGLSFCDADLAVSARKASSSTVGHRPRAV